MKTRSISHGTNNAAGGGILSPAAAKTHHLLLLLLGVFFFSAQRQQCCSLVVLGYSPLSLICRKTIQFGLSRISPWTTKSTRRGGGGGGQRVVGRGGNDAFRRGGGDDDCYGPRPAPKERHLFYPHHHRAAVAVKSHHHNMADDDHSTLAHHLLDENLKKLTQMKELGDKMKELELSDPTLSKLGTGPIANAAREALSAAKAACDHYGPLSDEADEAWDDLDAHLELFFKDSHHPSSRYGYSAAALRAHHYYNEVVDTSMLLSDSSYALETIEALSKFVPRADASSSSSPPTTATATTTKTTTEKRFTHDD